MADLWNKEVLMRSSVNERIWELRKTDPEKFKEEVRAYFARAYPGWVVVRAKYPDIFLRDERSKGIV